MSWLLGTVPSLERTEARMQAVHRSDVFIIAGEASGDIHGANLTAALRDVLPGLRCRGIGGERMAAQGVELRFHISDLAVVGLAEVAKHLPHILRVMRAVKQELTARPPAALILIDYPDFNLRLAKFARNLGIPVIYYISPQIWAWRRGRVKQMARDVSLMLVIFPFEEQFYRRAGARVRFVGHPLLDAHAASAHESWDWASHGLDPARPVIALLPGSRESEIKRLFDPFLVAGAILHRRHPDHQFAVVRAETVNPSAIAAGCAAAPYPLTVVPGPALPLLRQTALALTASGTATLDLALTGTPMVICYRMSPVSYSLARRLVRVDHIGLVNIVAGARLFPELIQDRATPHNIALAGLPFLEDHNVQRAARAGLTRVQRLMGQPGASRRAAQEIARLLAGDTTGD